MEYMDDVDQGASIMDPLKGFRASVKDFKAGYELIDGRFRVGILRPSFLYHPHPKMRPT